MKERPILFSGPMVRAILDGTKTQTRRVVPLEIDGALLNANAIGFTQSRQNPLHWYLHERDGSHLVGLFDVIACPYGQPGDRLWVRETWRYVGSHWAEHRWPGRVRISIEYIADDTRREVLRDKDDESGIPRQNMPEHLRNVNREPTDNAGFDLLMKYHEWLEKWWARKRPSIHMPRWACRLVLEVKAVRVERLQDISPDDVRREGVRQPLMAITGMEAINVQTAMRAEFRQLWDSLNSHRGHGWATNPWVWVIEFEVINDG